MDLSDPDEHVTHMLTHKAARVKVVNSTFCMVNDLMRHVKSFACKGNPTERSLTGLQQVESQFLPKLWLSEFSQSGALIVSRQFVSVFKIHMSGTEIIHMTASCSKTQRLLDTLLLPSAFAIQQLLPFFSGKCSDWPILTLEQLTSTFVGKDSLF